FSREVIDPRCRLGWQVEVDEYRVGHVPGRLGPGALKQRLNTGRDRSRVLGCRPREPECTGTMATLGLDSGSLVGDRVRGDELDDRSRACGCADPFEREPEPGPDRGDRDLVPHPLKLAWIS